MSKRAGNRSFRLVWKAERAEVGHDDATVYYANHKGMCHGTSVSWLEGVFRENLPVTNKPDLARALNYQKAWDQGQVHGFKNNINLCSAKEYECWDFSTRSEMVAWCWSNGDDSRGYVFSSFTDPKIYQYGHCCGFIKRGDLGYLMLPSTGLFECKNLTSVQDCMLKEPQFQYFETVPVGEVYAEAIRW